MKPETLRGKTGPRRAVLVALAAIALSVLAASAALENSLTHGQTELPSSVKGTEITEQNVSVGLNTDASLRLGAVPANASVEKTLNLSARNLSRARVSATGNITQVLEYDSLHYFDREYQIPIEANPEQVSYYNGTVSVKTATSSGELSKTWLESQKSWFSRS